MSGFKLDGSPVIAPSTWYVETTEVNSSKYYGVTVANGMVGLVSSPDLLNMKEIVLNGVMITTAGDVFPIFSKDLICRRAIGYRRAANNRRTGLHVVGADEWAEKNAFTNGAAITRFMVRNPGRQGTRIGS